MPEAQHPAERAGQRVERAAADPLPAEPVVLDEAEDGGLVGDRVVDGDWSTYSFSSCFAVDNTVTDQSSILRFIEDNWLGGQRIGGGSFDALADPLGGMLSFRHPDFRPLILNPATGQPVR